MTAIPRTFLATLILVFLQVTILSGQDKSAPNASDPLKSAKPMRAQLQEKQIDVSLEARDIERVLSKLKKASELSKQRITEAAIKAESASVSLERRDSKAASEEARQTAAMFKEIAKQLEALLKEETPQRIAEARQLAQQLAKAERDFAEQFEEALKPMQPTQGSGKAKSDAQSKATPKNAPDGNSDEDKSRDGNKGKGGHEREADQTGEMPQSKGEIGKDPADGRNGRDPSTDKNKPKETQAKEPGAGSLPEGSNDRDDKSGDKAQPEGGPGEKPGDKPKGGGSGKNKKESADRENKKTGPGGIPNGRKDRPSSNDQDDINGDKAQPEGGPGEKLGDKPKGGGSGKNNKKTGPGDTRDLNNGIREGTEKKPTNGASKEPGDKTKGGGSGNGKDERNEDTDNAGSGRGSLDARKTEGSGGAGIERVNEKRRNGMGQALTASELREVVAERAAMLAESGKTLQDVLQEIAKSTDPGDKDSVAKIEAVVKEINIDKLVEEMSQVSLMVRSKKDGDAKLSSLDVAERLEIMAQRLDTAYRAIVAPQAEELRKLEQALLDLRERLEKLETPSQLAGWHRDLRELLNELDKLGVSLQAREEFEKEMKKMGFSIDLDRTKQIPDWSLVDGRYIVPDNFKLPLINLQEDIQQRIQGLILGDLGNISDDAMPPKYQELVERYYQVLSRQNGTSGPAKKPALRIRK
jgi:hypothetical protein